MKRTLYFAVAAAVLFAGCNKNEMTEETAADKNVIHKTITVGLDNPSTKTALGTESQGKFPVVWTEGDEIAVVENLGVEGSQNYSVYKLKSGAGTSNGTFEYVSGDAYPEVIKDVIYPASAIKPTGSSIAAVTITDVTQLIPTTQTYNAGNFDPKAAVMHFHNETDAASPIILKPVGTVVCIPLKGKAGDVVTSLRWQHFDGGTRTFDLECPENGVALSDKETNFYIVVRPMGTATANAIAFVNLQNGAVQVKTPADRTQFMAGEMRRFPTWTMSRKSQWSVMNCWSERPAKTYSGAPVGRAAYLIDDNGLSWWEHDKYRTQEDIDAGKTVGNNRYPFRVLIDLGEETTINGIRFKAKEQQKSPNFGVQKPGTSTDIVGSAGYNPVHTASISFATSEPVINEIPSASGSLTKLTLPSIWSNTQVITGFTYASYQNGGKFTEWSSQPLASSVTARYILLNIDASWNNNGDDKTTSCARVAEFDIY